MVRPKKYKGENAIPSVNANFYMPPPFRKVWDLLTKLSSIDNNEEFIQYIIKVEGEDIKNVRIQGKRGLYIRWILYKHTMKNLHKVNQDKTDE